MIVVDANAIVKMTVTEEHSGTVFSIIDAETAKKEPIIAPDIILAEALNALWVNFTKKKKITAEQLDQAESSLITIFEDLQIIPTKELENTAMQIAKIHGLSLYDSLYAAAGLLNDAPVLSFDNKISKKAKAIGISLVNY